VLRSEDIRISTTSPQELMPNCATGVVEIISFLGTFSHVVVRLQSGEQVSTRGDRSIASSLRNGDTVYLSWDVDKVRLLG
jgi:ABC-type Fe3+/spermidine/putrescine transport system ATPase subunit